MHGALIAMAAFALKAHAAPQWNFRVTLDGKPIGEHRFTVSVNGRQRTVVSDARYAVKVLGLTVYRYAHHAEEQWLDDCLTRIAARTDDDGSRTEVQGQADADGFGWQAHGSAASAVSSRTACAMSFAYWNPAIASRTTLLDPGSGRLEPVSLQALPPSTIDVRGSPGAVHGLRILGLTHPIDVWYQGDEWVGLDTTVAGDRRLRYRLP